MAADPSAPICNCGARGCTIPGHQLAFVEFVPRWRRARSTRKRHKRGR